MSNQRAPSVHSQHSNNGPATLQPTTSDEPLFGAPQRKVTIHSVRSLHSTMGDHNNHNGVLLGSESSHRPHHQPLTIIQCLKTILFATKINVLLIFVPLGIIAEQLHWSDTVVFVLNFIAIIPLAKLLGYATEDIALRLGENLGALLNASFGNAVELILSIVALTQHNVEVVKASVLGSVLSNLLFVLGFCFLFGGLKYQVQTFNQTAAQTSASLLALSCMSMLIPAAFLASKPNIDSAHNIDYLSYGTAIVILLVYVVYLIFQLRTHSHLYASEDEPEEEPILPLWMSVTLLLAVTVLVAFLAEYLVGSIEGLSVAWGLNHTFIGLVLLPIVGNAAEHVTAVSVAMKNKMDLAIGVAIGSSMQIALFVTPLLVILGWIMQVPGMNLAFNTFETAVLFISVLIVNYLIQDGESNYLEGVMLLASYVIIAIACFFYDDEVGGAGAAPAGKVH
ncbi:hypothetical protein DFQ26_005724 [Actinomortierella ambigua]|nr:hypothetical protein DFQ26_005724 [Actinomortierella ambigua]